MPVTGVLLLLLLASPVLPAVVLPRPPSSPNYIPQVYNAGSDASKSYIAEKALYQYTNVEKPDTQQDYRFVEIEVRDAENVDSLDLHGLVQAVLDNQNHQHQNYHPRRLDLNDEVDADFESRNLSHPHLEVVPHSILGVRNVGLGPSQRLFESTDSLETGNRQHYLLRPSQATKNLGDEKLYYLKSGRPKVYVNFRGKTGNFRQDAGDSRVTMRFEPAAFLRATQPYHMEKKTKLPKAPKKYDPRLHATTSDGRRADSSTTSNTATTTSTTTENSMVTSSELPKQIPAPPSRIPSRSPIAHTTPVQRYIARRTDILPSYAFAEP